MRLHSGVISEPNLGRYPEFFGDVHTLSARELLYVDLDQSIGWPHLWLLGSDKGSAETQARDRKAHAADDDEHQELGPHDFQASAAIENGLTEAN